MIQNVATSVIGQLLDGQLHFFINELSSAVAVRCRFGSDILACDNCCIVDVLPELLDEDEAGGFDNRPSSAAPADAAEDRYAPNAVVASIPCDRYCVESNARFLPPGRVTLSNVAFRSALPPTKFPIESTAAFLLGIGCAINRPSRPHAPENAGRPYSPNVAFRGPEPNSPP